MGVRDEEYDPTERQKHQAELRKQLLRLTENHVPENLSVEDLEIQISPYETPVKAKGRHRKPKR